MSKVTQRDLRKEGKKYNKEGKKNKQKNNNMQETSNVNILT